VFDAGDALENLAGCIDQLIGINAPANITTGAYRKGHMFCCCSRHPCMALIAEAVASFTDEDTSIGRLHVAVGMIPES